MLRAVRLIPKRYMDELGFKSKFYPQAAVIAGKPISVSFLELAVLRLKPLQRKKTIDPAFARQLIRSTGKGFLNTEEVNQLADFLFNNAIMRHNKERELLVDKTEKGAARIQAAIYELKLAVGKAFEGEGALPVTNATDIRPGDQISPHVSLSFDWKIVRGDYEKEFEIEDMLHAARDIAFKHQDTKKRERAVTQYICDKLDLSDYTTEEAALLAQLIYQETGIPSTLIQGSKREKAEKGGWLLGKRHTWVELFWPLCSLIQIPEAHPITLLEAKDRLCQRFTLRPDSLIRQLRPLTISYPTGHNVPVRAAFNRIYRPMSYITEGSQEIAQAQSQKGAVESTLSLPGIPDEILYAQSLQGPRETMEDNMAIATNGQLILQTVSDGLGGHENGDTASDIANQAMLVGFRQGASLSQMARYASYMVWAFDKRNFGNEEDKYARTTLVARLYDPSTRISETVHDGDSRAYVARTEIVHALTIDHIIATADLRRRMKNRSEDRLEDLTLETLRCVILLAPPEEKAMTRSLGDTPWGKEIEVAEFKTEPGDLFLLASDGLEAIAGKAFTRLVTGNASLGARGLIEALFAALAESQDDNVATSAHLIK
ncbi:MAG: protein phosphatase 2C domain-containing protein [Candidatus Saganbacteria bacterium]|nr:protein phosphatase 2C domain-containing protein [Candidatus Saganbacteria bacterium]